MKISIFIVDDHFMVIEGIRSLLQNEKDIDWLGHATNADSCMSFLRHKQPDILLMDINLPDKSGVDLCKEVKQLYPHVYVLGISTFNQQAFIKNMIQNGASGYVLKNASKPELLEAIHTIIRGYPFFSKETSNVLKEEESHIHLVTRREKEVLQLIAEGMTNAEISEKLFISIPTVNTHRKNLLEKFEAKNTASLIKVAIQKGLLSIQ